MSVTYGSVAIFVELVAVHDPLHCNLPPAERGGVMLGVIRRKVKHAVHIARHSPSGRAIAFARGSPAHRRAPPDLADVLDHSASHVWTLVKPSRMNDPGMREEYITRTATELDGLYLLEGPRGEGYNTRKLGRAVDDLLAKLRCRQRDWTEVLLGRVLVLTVSKISLTTSSDRGVATQCSACSEVGYRRCGEVGHIVNPPCSATHQNAAHPHAICSIMLHKGHSQLGINEGESHPAWLNVSHQCDAHHLVMIAIHVWSQRSRFAWIGEDGIDATVATRALDGPAE